MNNFLNLGVSMCKMGMIVFPPTRLMLRTELILVKPGTVPGTALKGKQRC